MSGGLLPAICRLGLLTALLVLTSCGYFRGCPDPVFPELGDYTTTLPTGEEALVTLESERVVITYEDAEGQEVEVVYRLEDWENTTGDSSGP